ncbi:hypothetical protein AAG906_036715 [Vitis piasezkii]
MCNSINRLWTLLCYVCIGDCWDGDFNNFPSPGTSHGAWTHEIFYLPLGFLGFVGAPDVGNRVENGHKISSLMGKGRSRKVEICGTGGGLKSGEAWDMMVGDGGRIMRYEHRMQSWMPHQSSTFTTCSHSVPQSVSLSRKGAEKPTKEDRSSNRKDHGKMSQFQDQPSTDHHPQEQEQEQEAQGNIHDPELIQEKGGDNHVDDTVPSQKPGRPSLGELSAVEEENEGFRTPTSMEHKIPAITECPPAPRKPTATRAIPMKRRISKVPRRLQFEEFEVLIPPKILASLAAVTFFVSFVVEMFVCRENGPRDLDDAVKLKLQAMKER